MSDVLRRRGRASKLDAYRHEIGHRPDEEIAQEAGCTVANVYMYRRRHNLQVSSAPAAVEHTTGGQERRRGSVLDRYQHLLGKLSDAEVARLAGCTAANVSIYRRKHSIGARTPEAAAALAAIPAPLAGLPGSEAELGAGPYVYLVRLENDKGLAQKAVVAASADEATAAGEAAGYKVHGVRLVAERL